MKIKALFANFINLIMYAGIGKERFDDIKPDMYSINRRSCVYANSLSTCAFAVLFILAKSKISEAYAMNASTYFFAAMAFGIMLIFSLILGKNHPRMINALCYIYVVGMLHVGVYMASGPGKGYLTLSYIVFMVAIPLFFTMRPIYICITLVVTQVYYCIKIVGVQDGELLRANLINAWVYCIVSLIVVVFMMRIKFDRFGAYYQNRILLITDSMTGLYNRRSYEQKLIELQKERKEFLAVVYDINGLKSANDTVGHACGDELICGIAEIISKTFCDEEMYNYRIGGDEFVTIIEGVGFEKVEQVLSGEFTDAVKAWRGQRVECLHVSYGLAMSSRNTGTTVTEVIKVAESIMYENKSRFYKETGFERRKR